MAYIALLHTRLYQPSFVLANIAILEAAHRNVDDIACIVPASKGCLGCSGACTSEVMSNTCLTYFSLSVI